MQTLKIKYETSSLEDSNIIREYQKQYSSLLHYVYNRTCENISQKDIKDKVKSLSHINLLDSWFIQSSIFEAKGLYQKSKSKNKKIIFGGKKNFFDRLKGKISKSEYKNNRLSPIYSIGEVVNKSVKSNRKFHIEQDLNTIMFKPNKLTKIELSLVGLGNRISILSKLYQKQERTEYNKKVSYDIDSEEYDIVRVKGIPIMIKFKYHNEEEASDYVSYINKNEDGSYNFIMMFYNGGTDLSEMISNELQSQHLI